MKEQLLQEFEVASKEFDKDPNSETIELVLTKALKLENHLDIKELYDLFKDFTLTHVHGERDITRKDLLYSNPLWISLASKLSVIPS